MGTVLSGLLCVHCDSKQATTLEIQSWYHMRTQGGLINVCKSNEAVRSESRTLKISMKTPNFHQEPTA